jgi:uncharacterized protein (DUF2249 family)
MNRTITITISAALLWLAAPSTADAGSGSPGRKGTVAAYAPGPTELLDSMKCARKGKYTWDYVRCGKALRERVKEHFCRTRGKGTHKYWYQTGDSKKRKTSVYCRSGEGGGDSGGSTDEGIGGSSGRPGHKGTIAAYHPSRSDLLYSRACARKGKYTWDYVGCGKAVRARVKAHFCRTRGKGTHKYWYQTGDSSKRQTSVYCRR